jgi:TIR domain
MKIFISWSGSLSHKIACELRDWIPSVIQSIKPYVSSEDIDKGTRWSTDIAEELQGSKYGILCLTPDNIEAPWLNFEAGALSKTLINSFVSPFLIGLKPSDVKGPIVQFQSTLYNKEDIKKLLHSINNANSENFIEKDRLNSYFDVWWPKLEEKLNIIEKEINSSKTKTPAKISSPESNKSDEVLEEILGLVRNQQRMLRNPEEILPPQYIQEVLNNRNDRNISEKDLVNPAALMDLEKGTFEMEKLLSNPEAFEGSEVKEQIDKAYFLIRRASKHIIEKLEYNGRKKW